MRGSAIDNDADAQSSILAASRYADSIISTRYSVPLEAWPESLSLAVCKIAAYEYLGTHGYSPLAADEIVRERYTDAVSWLKMVGSAKAHLLGVSPKTASPTSGGNASVESEAERGWDSGIR